MPRKLNQEEFVKYLEIGLLITGDRPFDCPYLRVLPEDVCFDNHIPVHRDYLRGDLMCVKSIKGEQSALRDGRCQNFWFLKSKNKKLEVSCSHGREFYIELKPSSQ